MKIINLGAVRWLKAALTELPSGGSARAASRKAQQEEVDFFRGKLPQTKEKKHLKRV